MGSFHRGAMGVGDAGTSEWVGDVTSVPSKVGYEWSSNGVGGAITGTIVVPSALGVSDFFVFGDS